MVQEVVEAEAEPEDVVAGKPRRRSARSTPRKCARAYCVFALPLQCLRLCGTCKLEFEIKLTYCQNQNYSKEATKLELALQGIDQTEGNVELHGRWISASRRALLDDYHDFWPMLHVQYKSRLPLNHHLLSIQARKEQSNKIPNNKNMPFNSGTHWCPLDAGFGDPKGAGIGTAIRAASRRWQHHCRRPLGTRVRAGATFQTARLVPSERGILHSRRRRLVPAIGDAVPQVPE